MLPLFVQNLLMLLHRCANPLCLQVIAKMDGSMMDCPCPAERVNFILEVYGLLPSSKIENFTRKEAPSMEEDRVSSIKLVAMTLFDKSH